MNTLYDSEAFSVVHMQQDIAPPPHDGQRPGAGVQLVRHGFEIVDKRSGREVYLDGSWAELFHAQIQEWQRNTPTQEEVEDTLDSYTGLAQHPVLVH
ncbi:BTH_I0359 family protein [Vandammella animalimorsus]|uniref:DUF3567 domain-containing protein n=1 Tax=Vandammella animalimorsus TaxID=2029117 RepID=A0A2A2ALR4_9BURK|nr:DUF3567 domain-containing protein [Vandammella animalimorsus]PAT38664.1 hypothetical protein CK625_04240 [Vandammella animalimorsus]RMX15362.1 DUF3567 domain-containing protein [Vandammella animalimorsus]